MPRPDPPEAAADRKPAGADCEGEFDADAVLPSVLSLFSKAHTLTIAHEFATCERPLRFGEVEDRTGVPSSTLSTRLDELAAAGYLTRESHDEIPPRVEYAATEKTRALEPVFADLYDWAAEYGGAEVPAGDD